MAIALYLVLSLVAIVAFGVWGVVGAVIVGLAMLMANTAGPNSATDSRPGYKQVSEPQTGAGWKGMGNKKLSPREIELREMDTGTRHLGKSREAATAEAGASPWPSAK